MQPYASPMVGVKATFPQFNARAGHVISLEEPHPGMLCAQREWAAGSTTTAWRCGRSRITIEWVSTAEPGRKPFVGRGLVAIRDMTPDAERGKAIYAEQCAGCHGDNGQGRPHVFSSSVGTGLVQRRRGQCTA